jgi:hypothetical protein
LNFKRVRKMAPHIGIGVPEDGFTKEEEKIAELVAENSIETLYARLPNNRLKFIVAAHYELGYPQELVAKILGITQPSLMWQINLIKRIYLGKGYNGANRPKYLNKKEIKVEDMMKFLSVMGED